MARRISHASVAIADWFTIFKELAFFFLKVLFHEIIHPCESLASFLSLFSSLRFCQIKLVVVIRFLQYL